MKTLSLIEHNAGTYGPRTWINAGESRATCAFAVDFETAGERLTRKAAGVKYTHVDLKDGALDAQHAVRAARTLYRFLNERDARVLNVAGNGIYTLSEHGINQARIDLFLTSVLSKVHEHFTLTRILCGGQTGADLAGAVAGVYLEVETRVLMPRGFLQRDAQRRDACHSRVEIVDQIRQGVSDVGTRLLC